MFPVCTPRTSLETEPSAYRNFFESPSNSFDIRFCFFFPDLFKKFLAHFGFNRLQGNHGIYA